MDKTLPFYQLVISATDETGVSFVAMVDQPAIQLQWQAFNNNQKFEFKITNEERRIVSGALMVANLPIYRNNEQLGEHYVVFSPQTIEQIVTKFFKEQNTSNVNLMHSADMQVEGVTMIESLIIDSARGVKAPDGYGNLTEGSWFGSFKVENDEVWAQIKSGTFKGFSVEGMFDYATQGNISEPEVKKVEDVVLINCPKKTDAHLFNEQNKIMQLLEKILGKEAAEKLQKFMDANPIAAAPVPPAPPAAPEQKSAIDKNGAMIYTDKDFEVGSNVTVDSTTGKKPADDGEYDLDNGKTITVQGGVIVASMDTVKEDAGENEMKKMNDAVVNAMKEIEAAKSQMATQEETFSAQIKELKEVNAMLIKGVQELTTIVNTTPAAEPVAPQKNLFKKDNNQAEERLKNLAAALKTANKN